jgi:hypothetical protein
MGLVENPGCNYKGAMIEKGIILPGAARFPPE